MPSWDSSQYLKFTTERTQPAIDLALRIGVTAPRRVVDLGCGPGNSTAVLAHRWPQAELTGVDNSGAMLEAAARDHPGWKWRRGDIETWHAAEPYDVVFSNAALQWVGEHAKLFPHLLDQVAPGGALAVQMPANLDSPPQRLIRELAASAAWRAHFAAPPRDWHVHAPEFYYDLLARRSARVDVWCTEYMHVLPSVESVVDWYRGTGLRPWLEALADEATREKFLGSYRARLAPYFSPRIDGRVLFPFRRLFVIAYR